MFNYFIYYKYDEAVYRKQCKALEDNIPGLVYVDELIDEDGSNYRTYQKDGKKIYVCNEKEIDAISIGSEIELEHFFRENGRSIYTYLDTE